VSLALRSGVFVFRVSRSNPKFIWTALKETALPSLSAVTFVYLPPGEQHGCPLRARGVRHRQRCPHRAAAHRAQLGRDGYPRPEPGRRLKIFLGRSAAVRVEYRFQEFVQEASNEWATAKQTTGSTTCSSDFRCFLRRVDPDHSR